MPDLRSALRAFVYGQPAGTLDAAMKAAAAAAIPFPASGTGGRSYTWDGLLPSTKIDFQREAGDLSQSTAIMACIQWITRTFPEAPLQVKAGLGDKAEVVPDHPLTQLLTLPNPYYSGILLWAATLTSLHVSGNGYWLKVRSARGDVIQLWYEPHFTIGPTWDNAGKEFITGYRISRGGAWYDIARADVVHFRYGIDPLNTRLGLSPLASALREVFTDNEGANYSASILRNMGVPGLVVSPGTPDGVIDNPEQLKRDVLAKTTGDRRGEPLVMNLPTKVERIAWNPTEMNVREIRRIPEERIAALIGIPAVVVGLGAGLDRNTYSNARESREAAYESCIVPTQRLLAAELDTQLLPDLGDAATEHVGFDVTQVRALQEDRDKLVARNVLAYKGGLIRRAEGRRALGLETDANDEIFVEDLVNINARVTEVEPAGTLLRGDPDLGTHPAGADTGTTLVPSRNGHAPGKHRSRTS